MFERYTEKARRVVFFARYEASQFGADHIEPAHLLLGLLHEDKALTSRLLPAGTTAESLRARFEKDMVAGKAKSPTVDLLLSQSSKRILAYAAEEAQRMEHKNIDTAHLLLGMFREESLVASILREQGLTLKRLRAEAVHQSGTEVVPARPPRPHLTVHEPWPSRTNELPARATPLIGRQRELERALIILSRRTRNHVAFIGEPGVGKTTMVEGLADRVLRGDVPPCLVDRPFFSIRAAELLNPVEPDPPDLILAFDGLFDLAAPEPPILLTLEALLARGEVRVVATGTPAGWHLTLEKTAIIARYFEVVEVAPLGDADALQVLNDLKPKYEEFHAVAFSDDAVAAAVSASAIFLRDRPLPGRALDLLDDAGARQRTRSAKSSAGAPVITPQDIAEAVAQRVGTPLAMVQRVLSEPSVGELQRIIAALSAHVPAQSDWLPFLAAWLSHCSPQEAERLAQAIRTVRPK